MSGEEWVLQSFTWQTTGWNIISVSIQLLEISAHKCLVSCLELHLKVGWDQTVSAIFFLRVTEHFWSIQRKEGHISRHHWSCDGNRNGSVRTVWRPVPPCHQCYLPVLNCSRGRGDQTPFLLHISSGTHFFYFPTMSFQQPKLWRKWMSSTSVTHFSWSLQLLLSQTLLLLRDKCTPGCCSKNNMQIHHIWQALRISYICTFVPAPALGLPHRTAAKMHLKD